MHFFDKTFPKQNSLLEGGNNQLLSEKEFSAKILAANEAKQNDDFAMKKSWFLKFQGRSGGVLN